MVSRDREALKKMPIENVFLIYQQAGTAGIQNGALETTLRTGDFVLVDSTKTSTFDFSACPSKQISVPLTRPDVLGIFGAAASAGMVLRREAPATGAVRRALSLLIRSKQAGDASPTLVQTVLTAVRARMGSEDLGLSAVASIQAASRIVDRNFRDPDFGAPELAERLGLTPRAVRRVFQMLGAARLHPERPAARGTAGAAQAGGSRSADDHLIGRLRQRLQRPLLFLPHLHTCLWRPPRRVPVPRPA